MSEIKGAYLNMAETGKLQFFCEDCGHEFHLEIKENDDPDKVRCEKCNSKYVNHDYDRSIFKALGMPEMDKCDPSMCGTCALFCDKPLDDEPPKDDKD